MGREKGGRIFLAELAGNGKRSTEVSSENKSKFMAEEPSHLSSFPVIGIVQLCFFCLKTCIFISCNDMFLFLLFLL